MVENNTDSIEEYQAKRSHHHCHANTLSPYRFWG